MHFFSLYFNLEQYNQELRNKHDCDKCDRVGRRISRRNVFGACSTDKGTECGCAGHTAGERAEVVEKAELENVLRKEETDNHRNDGHDNTVYEIHSVEVFNKFCAAGDTCANKEEHKTKLAEELKSACRGHDINSADAREVTHNKAYQQATARCGEREAGAA